MKGIPAVLAFLLTILLILAAEAELPNKLLLAALFALLVIVLSLVIYRFSLGIQVNRPTECDPYRLECTAGCDRWGIALTASVIIFGVALLYFLD